MTTESKLAALVEGLEPCPFCGEAPRICEPHESDRSIEGETDDEEWLSFVECDCVDMFFVKGSATSQAEARHSVIAAWNRRAVSDEIATLKRERDEAVKAQENNVGQIARLLRVADTNGFGDAARAALSNIRSDKP